MTNLSMIIIPVYLVIITLIIVFIGKNVKTYKDFAIGGGKLPWYVVSGTILATSIGGGTLIGYVGSYYSLGMQWLWMALGLCVANMIMALFMAGRVNSLGQYTLPDILKLRYGKNTRIAGAIIVLLGEFAVVCAMLASFGAMLSSYLGLSFNISIILGAILFIVTATLGGLVGVAYTDAIQSILIVAGVIIVGALTFIKAGGFVGFSALDPNFTSLFAQNAPHSMMVGNVLSVFFLAFVSQSIFFQRVNACASPRDAKKAVLFSSIMIFICMGFFISSMGIGGRILLGSGLKGNEVLGALLSKMPPVIASLYAAAIIAAVLTTANSLLLSTSMNVSRDIFQEINKDIADNKLMSISKLYIVVATVIAFVVVKFNPSVIKWIMIAYTLNACLFIPMYCGLFWKKPGQTAGLLSISISGIGTVAWELAGSPFGIHSVFIGIGLGIVGLIIGILIGSKPTEEQLEVVDIFKQNKQTKNV